jgi:AIPR protein
MVFQCKNKPGLKPNELDKFRHDVDDLFIYGISKLNTELLQPKINEYRQLSKDGFIVEIKYYFVYAGSNQDPKYAANSQSYAAYHKPDEYEIWDAEAIYEKISQLIKAQAKRKDIKFTFNPQTSNIITADRQGQGLYTYSVGNVRAANFRIEADELCRLVEQELSANNTYEFLFSDNIRSFLGFKVRPNQRMKETLTDPDSAIYFPLLNNGVTIICERMEIPSTLQSGKYILPAYNPIVVNGLQTTRVIYEVLKESRRKGIDKLQNVFVNVRLYETSDIEIVEKITDATNTQTPISYKDKVSNKDFNLYAKEVFANQGIAYITKRGEVFSNHLSKQLKSTIESDTLYRFTKFEQVEKWWELIFSAYLMVSLSSQALLSLTQPPPAQSQREALVNKFANHRQWNHPNGWKNCLNNLRLIIQPIILLWSILPWLQVFPNRDLLRGFHKLIAVINQFSFGFNTE